MAYPNGVPDGTDEMMVFMIEGDPSTNIDCLYNLPGCNSSTQGDWTDGTPYPIINDDVIADPYEITYWPTIYHICPNRIVREVPQLGTEEIYAWNGDCAVAAGANNAGLLKYTGFSGLFCQTATFAPSVVVQNLGSEALTSATLELRVNGNLQETLSWTGSLSTYQLETVSFAEITVTDDAAIEITVTSANGVTDEDPANNLVNATATLSTETDQNILTLELRTDPYPGETYWTLLDGNGNSLYHGGNPTVVGGTDPSGAYTEGDAVYTHELPLPADGCYEFVIYDSYGDGICCVEGDGYFKLKDANGNIILQGGEFKEEDHQPFSIAGTTTPVVNNAAIVFYNGSSGEFCGELAYSPSVTIQNLGSNPISSAVVEVSSPSGTLLSYQWSGTLTPGNYASFSLGTVTVTETPVTIKLVSVNGEADVYDYQNTWDPKLTRGFTQSSELVLELQVDNYGYEIYWELQNSNGDVLYYGGNEKVGPDGGGGRVASASDPGAYGSNEYVVQLLELPNDVNDCYNLLLVDDWGDGMVDGGGGYAKISDIAGNVIVNRNLDNDAFTALDINLDVAPVASGTENLLAVSSLTLFPNPASQKMSLNFQLAESMGIQIEVYNSVGQQVRTVANRDFPAGANALNINVQDLANGFYYLKMTNGKQQLSQKFTVLNN